MKVLLSAYACAPGYGSEPEVGLQALAAALQEHHVWVLTQPHMAEELRPWLAAHPHGDRAVPVAVPPRAPVDQAGLGALARTHVIHERWQGEAARRARDLHAEVGFDVVHHVTLAAYWMRAGALELDLPAVWGPVGGAVEPPVGLLRELGVRGGVEDAVRTAVRLAFWRRPVVRRAARSADVVLVQNAATARRLVGTTAAPRVLPNALAASVPTDLPGSAAPRRRDVAVVGRVVAWKAVPLAVRVLAALPDRSTVLRVYGQVGEGERARVLRTANELGVAERVELVGKLPREELAERLATSGVLLHPSLHDEAPVTVAEALAVGTPVVALDHGGAPHVAAAWPGTPSRFVRPRSRAGTVRELAVAVQELLDADRPVAAQPLAPAVHFAGELRRAYAEAVEGSASRRARRHASRSTRP